MTGHQDHILVIDCATAACSVALYRCAADMRDLTLCDMRHDIIGRGHAEKLMPLIASLRDKGRANYIAVNVGPGSFTGVRIGLAAARALALAWNAQIIGYNGLALVAAMGLEQCQIDQIATGMNNNITVVVTGGHGEYFMQDFGQFIAEKSPLCSMKPQHAGQRDNCPIIAGDQAENLVNLIGNGHAINISNRADKYHLIAHLAPLPPVAIYGRAPDAKPSAA
ncbi:tRNA (adenosine(37)-N6)-threonylcarbamoyltransferase complex dimerization subunit type 1 TsaB [Sphingorhabdus lutea]|uniref:N(6)-L-threonylcarbamoyladenine synthase n=1 Tax=Sphingorhabdus lutea TaxID=1913578 RepID=A0A1L3JD32_9SPHN|nr:tRNA (adenosine(37)-N6)-threonylcarbamoyltransferase complex dimerization subunit type 1 TsaB [Sphingorhabdus lutea]APG63045.1 tRNA (adenosine(37)-N6)-threonylcarbamoyltransferase complex dimerization subunit type 1 TsaB [Sphingorhabdus lutea]